MHNVSRILPVAAVLLVFMPACLLGAESDWLTKYLPPAFDGGTPFTIKSIDVSRNHVDQEIIKADFQRTPQVVRQLAKEIKLVILPVGGGRHEAWANPGIAISPAQSGTINGIAEGLLDYRGKIPGGARAYLEMTLANAIKKQEPVRVSNVFWIGTEEQLQAAEKKDQADPSNKDLPTVALKTVADDAAIPAGMPVRLTGGSRSYNGTAVEKGVAGQALHLVVFAARPGGLFLPYSIAAPRSQVKVEAAALDAAKSDATMFSDRLLQFKQRLGQSSAPLALKPVSGKVSKGDRVVWFGFHGLMGGEALDDSASGRVKVRDNRFKQDSTQSVADLFVDPEPAAK